MKKIIFIIIPSIILALIVFLGFQYFLNQKSGKGALQVTSNPQSKVYLDGLYIGQTPLCLCEQGEAKQAKNKQMLTVGKYSVKIEPPVKGMLSYEEKVTIGKSVLTVVDRKFGKSTTSEGSIISLTPLTNPEGIELQVLTFPEGAEILLDSTSIGKGPKLIKEDVTESDHAVTITKNGYNEKTIRIRTPKGFRLTAVVYLGVNIAPTPEIEDIKKATPSASIIPEPIKKVRILSTPNGFLRVRKTASLSGIEITRVNTGEEFEVVKESSGWYQIKLITGKIGWVSGQFVSEVKN